MLMNFNHNLVPIFYSGVFAIIVFIVLVVCAQFV